MTRDSLIVSGETSRGYYIFQLVECGPDHSPCATTLTDRSGGVVRKSQSRFAIAEWIARKDGLHVWVLEICNRSDVPLSIRSTLDLQTQAY